MNCPLLIVGWGARILVLILELSRASRGGRYTMAFSLSLIWIPLES